jgi:hypothetical protein
VFAIGSSLREARLRQGLGFPEIEQATKIRVKHLKALEDEQFELLPGQTYVKGFLRTYAEYLGLDGQLYVDEFNSRYAIGEEEPAPIARTNVGPRTRRVESRLVLFVLLGIAAVTALVIAAWKSGGSKQPQAPVPGVSATNPPPPNRPHKKHKQETHKPPPRVRLVLRATNGASWIEAHAGASQAGYQLYQGTLETGQTLPLPGHGRRVRRLWLDVGQPANLTWKLNGKVRPAPGTDTAIFVVKPSGIVAAG